MPSRRQPLPAATARPWARCPSGSALNAVVEDRLLAHAGALQYPTQGVDHGAETGGCDLQHPAPGLESPEPAGRHLLGLDLGQPVAGTVGRVQDHLAAVPDSVPGAVLEEHLPRDRNAQPADRRVQDSRPGSGPQVPRREHVRRQPFHQTPQRHVLAERNRPDLVVTVDHRAVLFDRRLVVEVGRRVVGVPVEPAGHQHRIQADRLGGEGLGCVVGIETALVTPAGGRLRNRVDHVLRPHHQVHRRAYPGWRTPSPPRWAWPGCAGVRHPERARRPARPPPDPSGPRLPAVRRWPGRRPRSRLRPWGSGRPSWHPGGR